MLSWPSNNIKIGDLKQGVDQYRFYNIEYMILANSWNIFQLITRNKLENISPILISVSIQFKFG